MKCTVVKQSRKDGTRGQLHLHFESNHSSDVSTDHQIGTNNSLQLIFDVQAKRSPTQQYVNRSIRCFQIMPDGGSGLNTDGKCTTKL